MSNLPPVTASRILRAAPRRNILTKTLGSTATLAAAGLAGIAPYTFLYLIPIESPCVAARLGFFNPYNVAVTISKASIFPTDTYSGAATALSSGNVAVVPTGSGTSAAEYFDNSGADSPELNTAGTQRALTLPAVAANAGNAAVAGPIQWGDWVPVLSIPRADGGTQHLLLITVTVSTTDLVTIGGYFPVFNADATANRSRLTYILTAWNTGVDYADNPAGTNWKRFGAGNLGPLLAIQYVSKNRGIQVVTSGDSLMCSPGADNYSTMIQRAAWDLSTPALPIEVANLAWGGTGSSVFVPFLDNNAGAIQPSIVVAQINSRNDGSTGAENRKLLAKTLAAANRRSATLGSKLILASPGCQPSYDGLTAAQNMFLDTQATLAAIASQTGDPFIDGPSVIGDVAGGKPWNYLGGYSDDNTHPNYAGAEKMVPLAKAALSSLIS